MRAALFSSITVLVSLSGIIFATAEGSPLAGLTLIIALVTLFFVDLEEKFAVPSTIANLLGFVAFLAAGMEFFNGEIESRVLAGGHLIVYLTWVFLVQKKETRHIWWLCALSVLQVATGSVLTKSIWFGAALVAYAFVATWTLCVFLLYRSTFGLERKSLTASSGPDEISHFVVGDKWKGISRDVDHRLLNWRFFTITCTMTFLGLCLSFLFFVFTPRIWIGQFSFLSDEAMTGRPLTGFTETVRLGDMGEILENPEVVLELTLSDTLSEKPFTKQQVFSTLGSEPLFRGTVMEIYENGRWKQLPGEQYQRFSRRDRDAPITQKYRVLPIGSRALFSFGDTAYAQSSSRGRQLTRQQFSDEIKRDPEAPLDQPFDYIVRSNPGDFDTTFAEQRGYWSRFYLLEFFGVYQRVLRQFPDDLQRVRELAETVTESSKNAMEKAQRLERYFTESDEFTYSLDLSIQDASVDPIEDFLFNRKTGHCEYYASSMAMMLRSVGIPSRLVSGFKGGQYDEDRKLYLVMQLHAHSWVEAFIDGRWRVFDPTPATRGESVASQIESQSSLTRFKNRLDRAWSTGIQMSKTQQQELIYKPIQEMGQQSWQNARNLMRGQTGGLKELWEFLKSPGEWFSLRGGVFAFVLMLVLSGLVYLCRIILQALKSIKMSRKLKTARASQVEFYRRLLAILKKSGIEQAPTETAKEFLASAFEKLSPQLQESDFQDWSHDFVTLFYDVRFGQKKLTEHDAQQIDKKLHQLEAHLNQPPGGES